MPEFDGPWSKPTPPPAGPSTGPNRRIPAGLAIWAGILAAAIAAVAFLTWKFPTAVPKAESPDVWYLFGLLALVTSGLVGLRRVNLATTLRNLAAWTAIFAVIFVGYTFRGDLAAAGGKLVSAAVPEHAAAGAKGEVVIGRGAGDGFYVAGTVNDKPARFLVDTGASDIVLSQDDAARAGLTLTAAQYSRPSETANGVGFGAPIMLKSLTVGAIRLTDVPVQVNKAPMSASLLGMAFLKRLESFEVKGDQLILHGR